MNDETMLVTSENPGIWVCFFNGWHPAIGDPDVTGWLTVLSYLICCGLAVAVLRMQGGQVVRRLWQGIAVLLLLLAINKQLDLQTALTAFGRCLSHAQGWWENRRPVQIAFILGLLFAMTLVMAGLVSNMRGRIAENALALTGLGVLCSFVLVRAVGFHSTDSLITATVQGISLNFVLENLGLVLIALNAVALLRRTTHPQSGG